MNQKKIKKTPSREICENEIKRILSREALEHGTNQHFRTAADFMNYFESLYPASDALTKQVQRAVKSLNMPKDDKGYFIANKTIEQLQQEKELKHLFEKADVTIDIMNDCETVFLSLKPQYRSYIIYLLETSINMKNTFLTFIETSNGIIIYTRTKEELIKQLNYLTI